MAHDRPAWVGLEDAPLVARGAPSGAVVDMHGDGGSVNDHLRRELAARGGESTTLRITGAAAASVDAYIEYKRIVGNADGGVMFTGTQHASRSAKWVLRGCAKGATLRCTAAATPRRRVCVSFNVTFSWQLSGERRHSLRACSFTTRPHLKE